MQTCLQLSNECKQFRKTIIVVVSEKWGNRTGNVWAVEGLVAVNAWKASYPVPEFWASRQQRKVYVNEWKPSLLEFLQRVQLKLAKGSEWSDWVMSMYSRICLTNRQYRQQLVASSTAGCASRDAIRRCCQPKASFDWRDLCRDLLHLSVMKSMR